MQIGNILKNGENFFCKKKNLILNIFVAFIIVLILFFLPKGDDISFHLQRLNAITEDFSHKGFRAFPTRIYHSTNEYYGYASPLFYGDLFMWPFAVIASLFHIPIIWAYKLMLIVTFIFTILLTKYAFSRIFVKRTAEYATFFYIVSVTIYSNATNSCVGRDFAGAFIPLAFCTVLSILFDKGGETKNIILLALSVAGVTFSNLLDLVIVVFSLFFLCVFMVRKITFKKLLNILISIAIYFCITAWFILPMIEQMKSQEFFVTSKAINQEVNDLSKFTIPLLGWFLPSPYVQKIYSVLGISTSGYGSAFFYGAIFFVIILIEVVYCIFKYKNNEVTTDGEDIGFEKKDRGLLLWCVTLLCIFLLFNTKLFPHSLLKSILGVMQFPWRVRIVLTFLGALLTVYLLKKSKSTKYVFSLFIINMALISIFFVGSYAYKIYVYGFRGYFQYEFDSMSVGSGEYLPVEMLDVDNREKWKEFIKTRGDVVICSDESVVIKYTRNYDELIVEYDYNTSDATFELPLIYYYGYTAVDANGESVPIRKNSFGLIEIKGLGEKGVVKIEYKGTTVQKITYIISVIGTSAVMLYCVFRKRKDIIKLFSKGKKVVDENDS